MHYTNKTNQRGLEDIHWLLADDVGASWFYQRVAREIMAFQVPLAGGGTTTLGTKVTWQANEFAQIKALVNRNHALLTVLSEAVSALAESSNADADEVKALIAKKMDEATATLKIELDELQSASAEEVPAMASMSFELPDHEEEASAAPTAVVVPEEVPAEGPGLNEESTVVEDPKVEAEPSETAPNAAPVSNV